MKKLIEFKGWAETDWFGFEFEDMIVLMPPLARSAGEDARDDKWGCYKGTAGKPDRYVSESELATHLIKVQAKKIEQLKALSERKLRISLLNELCAQIAIMPQLEQQIADLERAQDPVTDKVVVTGICIGVHDDFFNLQSRATVYKIQRDKHSCQIGDVVNVTGEVTRIADDEIWGHVVELRCFSYRKSNSADVLA